MRAFAGLGVLLLACVPVFAQGRGPKPPTGPAPKMSDGKPDLSGMWQRPYTPDMSIGAVNMDGKPYPQENPNQAQGKGKQGGGPKLLPYTAWGAEQWKNYDAQNGDYTGACLPFGLMRSINSPDPLQIMQSATYVSLLFEQNTWFHVFPIDARPHGKGIPTWFGDSVGKWEGDTLVVETVNFNGKTRLDTIGHPHSDQLILTERYTRPNLAEIQYEMKVHDPKTYTEDWKNVRRFNLRNDWEIMEYSCEENNKSFWEGRIKVPKF